MTHTTMRSKIRSWINANVIRLPDAIITDAINMAQEDVASGYGLLVLEKSDSGSVVFTTGQNTVGVPIGFLHPVVLSYQDPDDTTKTVTMDEKTYREFVTLYGTKADATSTDDPIRYAVFTSGGAKAQLYIGPTPQRDITAQLDYVKKPVDVAADNDETELMLVASRPVMWKALSYCADYTGESDTLGRAYEVRFTQSIELLTVSQRRARYAGEVRPRMEEA